MESIAFIDGTLIPETHFPYGQRPNPSPPSNIYNIRRVPTLYLYPLYLFSIFQFYSELNISHIEDNECKSNLSANKIHQSLNSYTSLSIFSLIGFYVMGFFIKHDQLSLGAGANMDSVIYYSYNVTLQM